MEIDYINPIDLCNKLNQVRLLLILLPPPKLFPRRISLIPVSTRHQTLSSRLSAHPTTAFALARLARANTQFVLPEMIAHAFLTLCFLLSGQWIAFLLNAPLVGYNVNK